MLLCRFYFTEPRTISTQNKQVIICGGGVIGAATAYFLSLRNVSVAVVERCSVACAASGKSGGFLALDWCDGSPLRDLARKSFALHAELAKTLPVDYGYRRMTTFSAQAGVSHPLLGEQAHPALNWLDSRSRATALLGTEETTAQVHPGRFTQALMEAARKNGARLIIGRVQGVILERGEIRGVRVDGNIVAADAVVIAMGPWSSTALPDLPLPAVHGLKGHSITLRPENEIPPHALFLHYTCSDGKQLDPEVYPRPDGEVYLCGISDYSTIPDSPEEVAPQENAGRILTEVAAGVSSSLQGLQPERVQACYRPVCGNGLPLLGPVSEIDRLYLATGHSCWGILNAPASGAAMAELICEGNSDLIDLRPFYPLHPQPIANRL